MKSIDEEKELSDESENNLVAEIKEFVSGRYGSVEEAVNDAAEEKAENQEK